MALGADFDLKISGRGARFKRVAANTGDDSAFIRRVNAFFHGKSPGECVIIIYEEIAKTARSNAHIAPS